SQNNIDNKGYWDSGCSRHMTGNISYLSDFEQFDGGYVSFGQGGCKITGKGTIKTDKLEFENVYFVKDIKYNLFSVSQICDNKNSVLFTDLECIVLGRDFKLLDDTNILLRTPRQHNMYSIDLNNIIPHRDLTCLVAKASDDECILWHWRLGHLNFKIMNKLVRYNLVRRLPTKCFENDHTCTACLRGKQHKASCKSKLVNSVSKPLHTLHMDVFVPTSVSSISHKWYCLVVTDDFSRFTWTLFLKSKDETSGILKEFITEIENLKDLKVKIIRCDNEGEFRNKEMNDFCSQKGIKREFSNARTTQQNGVTERRNRTLIEAARTMLADAKLPVTFWAEAVNTACYVQNMVLVNKSHNKTPYELFNGRSPAIGFLKPFGCHKGIKREFSNARTPQQNGVAEKRNKTLIEAARTMVLVNKSQNKTPYELFNGRTPAIGFFKPFGCHVMILITLDNLGKFKAKGDAGYFIGYSMSSKAFKVFNKRTRRVEENLHVEFLKNKAIEKGAGPNWLFDIDSLTKSMNYVPVDAGINSTNLSGTKVAASQEVRKDVSSLRYIALPNWVYDALLESSSSKPQDDCSTDVPESRGNPNPTATSINPLDDQLEILTVETPIPTISSPVLTACFTNSLKPSSDTRLISKRIANQVETPSLDNILTLTNRFEDIFRVTTNSVDSDGPLGFQDPEVLAKVYKVEKEIEFKALMHEKFQMSAMGELNIFLGLQVLQKEDGIFLTQDKYVGDILKKFGYSDVRSSNTPMDKENPWDIMFAVYACARNQVTPKEYHLYVVKRIFRYLKGHPKLGLWYPKESLFDLVAYSDSDYGGATQDSKSTTGGCQFLGRRLFSWQYKKQTIMATLTTEAEYVVAANLLTKPFDAGRFQYLVCKLFPLLGKLSTVSVFLGFGLTFAGTSKYWDVLRILMISLRLIPLSEHNIDFHLIVDFIEASPLRRGNQDSRYRRRYPQNVTESSLRRNLKLKDEEGISSLQDVELFENPTLGEGSGTPTEPYHTPSPEAQQTSYTTHSSPTLPPVTTALIPTVTSSDTHILRQYTRRAKIAQSSALPPVADEHASPLRDVSEAPRVTSLTADEGSMQLKRDELTGLCTGLQRQHSEMVAKFEAQELEINRLKARVKLLEDREGVAAERSGDNAPIKGRNLDEGEVAAERVSDDTKEMETVLTSMDATTFLASGVAKVPTGSGSIPTAGPPATEVPTGSDVVPTAGPIFATATVVTPYTRRKGKETMVESKTSKKKKIQKQIDIQMARQMEEEMERDA
nr:putative ribonuclease H-like domain-containing protein [Tanacetum cinerariifolium]